MDALEEDFIRLIFIVAGAGFGCSGTFFFLNPNRSVKRLSVMNMRSPLMRVRDTPRGDAFSLAVRMGNELFTAL